MVVLAIFSILAAIGYSVLQSNGTHARKASTDRISALLEQARTTAITQRTKIVLAIAEPGDLPVDDGKCRIGLFKIPDWQDGATSVEGVLLRRWMPLDQGIVLIGGNVEGLRNVMDEQQITITYAAGNRALSTTVQAVAFNPRGGLAWPTGSDPITMRIAEGGYRGPGSRPIPNKSAETHTIPENRLKIGRVLGRAYRFDK